MNAKNANLLFVFKAITIDNGSVPLLTTLSLNPSNSGFPVFALCGYFGLIPNGAGSLLLSDLSFKQFILDSSSSMAAIGSLTRASHFPRIKINIHSRVRDFRESS
jgi:hypothetical protein